MNKKIGFCLLLILNSFFIYSQQKSQYKKSITKDTVYNNDKTTDPPATQKLDLNAMYQKRVAEIKQFGASTKNLVEFKDPQLARGNYEFGARETNVDRYKNSPCFNKLGFNPNEAKTDSIRLEAEYKACEKEYRMNKLKKLGYAFICIIIPTLIGLIIYNIFKKVEK